MNNRGRKILKRQKGTVRGRFRNLPKSTAPVARSSIVRYMDPYISETRRSRSNGLVQCRIRHRELVTVIDGSVDFNVITIPVQPGLSSTFPWLSNMAMNWENYKFNKIAFRFVSRSSTSFTGSVVIAPDYDASDAAPGSYQEMSTFQNAISDAPWKDILCILNPRSTSLVGNSRYTRFGVLGPNEDIKLYDAANLYLATVGQAGGSVIGELWVEYDVLLQIPQLQSGLDVPGPAGQYFTNTGIDVTHLLGTAVDAMNGSILIGVVSNNITLTGLSPGEWYLVNYTIDATTSLTTIPTLTVTDGFDGASGGVIQSVTNGTTKAQMTYLLLANNSIAHVVLGGLTVVTGAQDARLYIAPFLPILP